MSRLVSAVAVLSYPNIFTPRPLNEKDLASGKSPKYQAAFVFLPSEDPAVIAQYKAMKQAAIDIARAKWATKLTGNISLRALDTEHGMANFLVSEDGDFRIRLPWRDDASVLRKKGYPEGSFFFNASTLHKPQVVTQIPYPVGHVRAGKPMPLEDESMMRAGALVVASLDPYAYEGSSNGVTFGLGNLQYIGAGDPDVIGASAGANASDEFSADASVVADLSDVGADEAPAAAGDDITDLLGG